MPAGSSLLAAPAAKLYCHSLISSDYCLKCFIVTEKVASESPTTPHHMALKKKSDTGDFIYITISLLNQTYCDLFFSILTLQILMVFKFNGICVRFSASADFLKILFLFNYSLLSRPFCISFRCTARWPENRCFTEWSPWCFKHPPGLTQVFFTLFKIVKYHTHTEKSITIALLQ